VIDEQTEKRRGSFWRELPILLGVAILVAVLVRAFVLQTFYIPSPSMEHTLNVLDRVLVNKLVYDFREPRRGEIVVFKAPPDWQSGTEGEDFIKRIIGVGGDHVVCCDANQHLMINGHSLNEPYIFTEDGTRELRDHRAVRPALGDGRPPGRLRRLAGALRADPGHQRGHHRLRRHRRPRLHHLLAGQPRDVAVRAEAVRRHPGRGRGQLTRAGRKIDPERNRVGAVTVLDRRAARVVLVDHADRILLLRGCDPARPGPRWWFTPGGGLHPGESTADGAVRELFEETGLRVTPGELGEPVWHQVTQFSFDNRQYRQEQDFYLVRVAEWQVDTAGFNAEERATIDEHRWWSAAELDATDEIVYPENLVDLVRRLTGGA
jgi:signal peptidase I